MIWKELREKELKNSYCKKNIEVFPHPQRKTQQTLK